MRIVYLRGLDGLIVCWGIMACLLISGGRELLAAPGDCNKDCRMPFVFASYDGTKNTCLKFELGDCRFCTGPTGGCNSNEEKSKDPSCEEDTTMKRKYASIAECKIYCTTITKDYFYEATTSATEFKYKDSELNYWKCMPKTGGLP